MRFTHQALHGLGDAQQNFEQLEAMNFLQVLSTQQAQIAFGTVLLTWPGGSSFSNTVNAAHGLGRVSQGVALTGQFLSNAPFAAEIFINGTPGAVNIPVQGNTPGATPVAGTTCTVFWVAIG